MSEADLRIKASEAACRVPAADIESIVEDRICALLNDEAAVFSAFGATTIASRKGMIEHATDLARRWPALRASEKRAILQVVVERVDIRPTTVDVAIRLATLPDIARPPGKPDGPVQVLSVPAQLRRTGLETKLLIQDALGVKPPRRSDRSLLRLIAMAHRFNALVTAGAGLTVTERATQAGVSRSYFSRILRLSFLAPEITKAILQGRQPFEFNAIKLMGAGQFAYVWSDQHRQLGFD